MRLIYRDPESDSTYRSRIHIIFKIIKRDNCFPDIWTTFPSPGGLETPLAENSPKTARHGDQSLMQISFEGHPDILIKSIDLRCKVLFEIRISDPWGLSQSITTVSLSDVTLISRYLWELIATSISCLSSVRPARSSCAWPTGTTVDSISRHINNASSFRISLFLTELSQKRHFYVSSGRLGLPGSMIIDKRLF